MYGDKQVMGFSDMVIEKKVLGKSWNFVAKPPIDLQVLLGNSCSKKVHWKN